MWCGPTRDLQAAPLANPPYNETMDTPVTIVILAAGLGTRMKSRRAKVLHRAGGRTLVEHVVRTAAEITTPERIYVVVGHQAEQVRATLAPLRRRLRASGRAEGHRPCSDGRARSAGGLGRAAGDPLRRRTALDHRHVATAGRNAEEFGSPPVPSSPPSWRTPPATAA